MIRPVRKHDTNTGQNARDRGRRASRRRHFCEQVEGASAFSGFRLSKRAKISGRRTQFTGTNTSFTINVAGFWVLLARGNERVFAVTAPWYVGERS